MEQNLIDIYDLIEHAIDNAFEGKMNLKFYEYLKDAKIKKNEIDEFISSPIASELGNLILDLGEYIKGGSDSEPQARKIRNYLESFLHDAERYSYDRRPGRRKKHSK